MQENIDIQDQIAKILVREWRKLPIIAIESQFITWGAEGHFIQLGMNPKRNLLLSFGYSDLDGFHYQYQPGDTSYEALASIFREASNHSTEPGNPAYFRKVMAVLVFYHSGMKRVRDLS